MASLIGKNRAIRIPELDANGSQYFEYVGPEVDIGFRLGKHAPAGRVIVPYELPILLEDYGLKFEQIGEASLQGVAVNPYPLWLVVE
jgi:class 3 adenylate cyclase